MIVLGIDPGPTKSGYALYSGSSCLESGECDIEAMLTIVGVTEPCSVVIERVAHYGMAVGASVFETVFVSGQLFEAARVHRERARLPFMKVKMHFCHNSRAKESNVRQALLDRFGGRELAVGRKKSPGPFYGVKGHAWSALALAVAYHDGVRE